MQEQKRKSNNEVEARLARLEKQADEIGKLPGEHSRILGALSVTDSNLRRVDENHVKRMDWLAERIRRLEVQCLESPKDPVAETLKKTHLCAFDQPGGRRVAIDLALVTNLMEKEPMGDNKEPSVIVHLKDGSRIIVHAQFHDIFQAVVRARGEY